MNLKDDIWYLLRSIQTFEYRTSIRLEFEIEIPMKLEVFVRKYIDQYMTIKKPDKWFDYQIIEKEDSFVIRNK